MTIDPTWTKLEWTSVQNQASIDERAIEIQKAQNKDEEEVRNDS